MPRFIVFFIFFHYSNLLRFVKRNEPNPPSAIVRPAAPSGLAISLAMGKGSHTKCQAFAPRSALPRARTSVMERVTAVPALPTWPAPDAFVHHPAHSAQIFRLRPHTPLFFTADAFPTCGFPTYGFTTRGFATSGFSTCGFSTRGFSAVDCSHRDNACPCLADRQGTGRIFFYRKNLHPLPL